MRCFPSFLLALGVVTAALAPAPPGRAAPGDTLFRDDFERATLAPWTTTNATRSGILTGAQVSNSPTRGLYTRRNPVTTTSPSIAAAVPAADVALWVRRGSDAFSEDPDGGEDLVLEYRRADASWGVLASYNGGGTPGQIHTDVFDLPSDALHGTLALRVRQTGGSGTDFDYWHIDDVVVTERALPPPLSVGSCDDFESGLGANWTIATSGGFAGTGTATAASPTRSLFLNGGVVSVTSAPVDTSLVSFSDLSLWIRRGDDAFSEDPDPAEDLVVEYLDDGGSWVVLETFAGGGLDGEILPRVYTLPAAGRHAGFRVRFRQTAGSGATWDYWHIDDVCWLQNGIPDLLVLKTMRVLSDPVRGGANPLAIPGAVAEYRITVSNQGPGAIDLDTVVLDDPIPPDTELFVGDLAGPGTGPIRFLQGSPSSGLSYTYLGLGDGGDDLEFESGGAPYTPGPPPPDYDPAVDRVWIRPKGVMAGGSPGAAPSFTVILQVRVR